jgi:hypothetical protein
MFRGPAWLAAVTLFALQAAVVRGAPSPQPSTADPARLIAALRSKVAIEPVRLAADPYSLPQTRQATPASRSTVCGVRFEPDQVHYQLATFADTAAARAAGFAVTHFGACGTCSTLQDLAVYLEKPDLTTPVRKCAARWHSAAAQTCLELLGFSSACARTWLYDAQNTRRECFKVCVWSWMKGEPPTSGDGRLNACLQCDEDRSGPVFKTTAGRTRRNSGIRSSIPRPDDEVAPVVHDYVPDLTDR